MVRALFGTVGFLVLFSGFGQNCLTLLDSARYYRQENPAKARNFAEALIQSLDSAECIQEIGYAEAYTEAGLLLNDQKEQARAVYALEQALKFKKEQTDSLSVEMLDYANNLYFVHKNFGSYVEARFYLDYLERIVTNGYSRNSLDFILFALNSSGFYREIGELDRAQTILDEAIGSLDRNFPTNDSIRGQLLIESGTLSRRAGDYRKANETFEHAIKFLRGKFPTLHATAVDRLAQLNLDQGKFSVSESELLSNINFKRNRFPEDSLLQVESLNNLGQLYFRINDLESARSYFLELKLIAKSYPGLMPYVENNLAVISERQGKHEQAYEQFDVARKLFLEAYGPFHPDYASCLSNMAGIQRKLGHNDDALTLYMKVLDLDRAVYGTEHERYANSLTNIAKSYISIGYKDLALKFLNQSARVRLKALGARHYQFAKSLNELGNTYLLHFQDTVQALTLYDSALHIEIRHLHDVLPVLTERQRTLFYDEIRTNQLRFSSIAFSPKYVQTEWSEKALDHYINTKSILFYAADRLRALSVNSKDPNIRNKYTQWREMKFDLAKAYLLSEEERRAQRIFVEQLEATSQRLEKELSLALNLNVDEGEAAFYTWQDISDALPDSTALLEILEFKPFVLELDSGEFKQGFLDESNYVAFLIKPGERLITITWPESTDFEASFKFYRNSMLYGFDDDRSHSVLWSRIETQLGRLQKLYFSADGEWHQVNPAIFYNTDDRKFVGEDLRILHITSGKDLIQPEEKSFNRKAFVVGNPEFSNIDAAVGLPSLPQAEVEAEVVADLLRKNRWNTDRFFGADATEEKLKGVSGPGIIHLATHGYFFENKNPNPLLNSGLFLSKHGDDDGVLSAYEAMNLNLTNTRLVVLSACETGLGEVQNGEGVFGLQRALLVAGANNLIISLVKVGDKATRDFMEWFYQYLLETDSVQDAYFLARRDFKESYPATKDWGSFILLAKH